MPTLGEQLSGARLVLWDPDRELTLAWFGGHGVHAYTNDGREVSFWNTGDFSQNDATPEEVEESMRQHMVDGYYP